ncbi:hypothetical protein ACL2XP_13995 [Sodalis sp. RH21]|uniref:hypothetical protein n=1 Tax=unclassified Sodalis (in: enterobacteria) TaxID=2636512 RepID=UPI0039B5C15C
MTTAKSVVATGAPARWTIFNAVLATASLALGIGEYAAAMDGILIEPCPAPDSKRLAATHVAENGCPIIQRNAAALRKSGSTPPGGHRAAAIFFG